MSEPTHVGDALQRVLADIRRRVAAGELGETPEQRKSRERRELRARQAQARATSQRRLEQLRRSMPEHYAWATQHKRAQWTQIREELRTELERDPGAWVLVGSPPGNAKTTALVAEGIRAVKAGRSVVYVSAPEWRELVRENLLLPAKQCGVLLLDEMHLLAGLPDWVLGPATGVIDYRYRRKRTHQVLGAGTFGIDRLIASMPPGIGDRFDVRMESNDESQRRKPNGGDS